MWGDGEMGEGLRDYQKKLVGAWDLQEDSFQNGGSRRQGIYEGKYLLLSSSILSGFIHQKAHNEEKKTKTKTQHLNELDFCPKNKK